MHSQVAVSHDERCRSNIGMSQAKARRKGRKDENYTDRQQPGGQDGQPRLSETFYHTGQQQIPHRDLKEDVAGTCGRRSTETAMKRHREMSEAKIRLLSWSLSLLCVQRKEWSEGKTKKDSWCLQ